MDQEIEKYVSGNMTVAEQHVFLKQMKQDAELYDRVIKMKHLQAILSLSAQSDDNQHAQKGLKTFHARLNAREKRRQKFVFARYAAAIVILVLTTWMIASRYALMHDPVQFTEIEVPKGQCVNLTLADGSKAWLSPQTKLRIPNRFNQKKRIIELDGEGYFDVSRDKKKPFIVKTTQYDIQVLGTEFNVFAYSKLPDKFETCLVKGKVKIYPDETEERAVYLEPNEKVVLVDNQIVKCISDFGNGELAKKGIFSFRMKTFSEILDYLALWYDVHFTIQGKVELNREISGKFHQNGEVSMVLEALKGIYNFKYRKVDDTHYIIFN